jgi:hypothetical protein
VQVSIAVHHFTLFGPAEVELQVVLLGETDAAMDLVRGSADPAAGVAGPGFRHGDFLGCVKAIGQAPGGTVGDETRPVHVNHHVSTLVFDGLKTADGSAKLDPVFGVVYGHIEGGLRHAHHLGALCHGGVVKRLLDQGPALVQGTDQRLRTDLDVAKFHLELSVRSDGLERRLRYARRVGRHEEQTEAVFWFSGIARPHRHQQGIGRMGVGDKQLRPIDDKAAVVCGGTHANPRWLETGARLGEGERAKMLPPGDSREIACFLALAATEQHRQARSILWRETDWAAGPARTLP